MLDFYSGTGNEASRPRVIVMVLTAVCGSAALTVAGIFYTWRTYHDLLARKQRTLRERVTYLLWVAAQGVTS